MVEKLLSSDTPRTGITVDRQNALALLPRLHPDPAYQSIVHASIENSFGFQPEDLLIFYRRVQRTEVLNRLDIINIAREPERKVTITGYDMRVVFVPEAFPDTTVLTTISVINTNYPEIVPTPRDSVERVAAVLQAYDSTFFSSPSPEEEAILQRLGLHHPSRTHLAGAAQRLQTIPAHSEQQQALWIALFSQEAWQELLGDDGTTFPGILGLNTDIIRIPGTALLTLDQNGLHKTDNPQEHPRRNTSVVADKIEGFVTQLLQSSNP